MTTNIYRAAQGILQSTACTATEVSQALAAEGHLTPAPQIIRTVEELEALDPDTVMQPPLDELGLWPNAMSARSLKWSMRTWDLKYLPAVVIVPGEQVRAARKALEKETE